MADCIFEYCDTTDESQIIDLKDLLRYYDQIDIPINNAAIDPKVKPNIKESISRLENFSIDQWNLEISVGLTGAMLQ